MVEIAKALSYNASVLIMDEPTATLTEHEAGTLLDLVDQLRKTGVTIVFISHILPQVLRISDRITVLRDGNFVDNSGRTEVRTTSERDLASLMVGRPMTDYFPPRVKPTATKSCFPSRNLSVPDLGRERFLRRPCGRDLRARGPDRRGQDRNRRSDRRACARNPAARSSLNGQARPHQRVLPMPHNSALPIWPKTGKMPG